MIKKDHPYLTKPISNMRVVLDAIDSGCTYKHEVVKHTSLKEGQVSSAIWNLTFIGAIQKRTDEQGRRSYTLPCLGVGRCLCGVNSIFNSK